MKSGISQQKKGITEKEIDALFQKIKSGENTYTPLPPMAEEKNITDHWIIVGGSSKFDNNLFEVSTWQTGQAY